MAKYHPSLELAPRDVVSRSIITELKQTNDSHVYLDMTHLDKKLLKNRFPNIMRVCLSFGLDIRKDLIPVRPTAHYTIGGIKTNIDGHTTIDRLYACGETACVGVHGANRLASNSLLEGLVFGYRAGYCAGTSLKKPIKPIRLINPTGPIIPSIEELNIEDVKNSLKSLMWRDVGIEREKDKLLDAQKEIDFWSSYVLLKESTTQAGFELQNLLTIGKLILQSALMREESRGVHYRKDFPQKNDAGFKRHIEAGIRYQVGKREELGVREKFLFPSYLIPDT